MNKNNKEEKRVMYQSVIKQNIGDMIGRFCGDYVKSFGDSECAKAAIAAALIDSIRDFVLNNRKAMKVMVDQHAISEPEAIKFRDNYDRSLSVSLSEMAKDIGIGIEL